MQRKDQKSAKESYAVLSDEESRSFLIDVRSSQEWEEFGVAYFIARPEALVLCEWRSSPSMEVNENFFNELSQKLDFQKVDKLYFICAAGVRSQEASNHTESKFKELSLSIDCINVFDGFTGSKNMFFNFGNSSGWKDAGLPYCQLTSLRNDNSGSEQKC